MTVLVLKPLETLGYPLPKNLPEALEVIDSLIAAIHELNSKIEFIASETSVSIPSSNQFTGATPT